MNEKRKKYKKGKQKKEVVKLLEDGYSYDEIMQKIVVSKAKIVEINRERKKKLEENQQKMDLKSIEEEKKATALVKFEEKEQEIVEIINKFNNADEKALEFEEKLKLLQEKVIDLEIKEMQVKEAIIDFVNQNMNKLSVEAIEELTIKAGFALIANKK